jgi:hypothetical protein
VKLGLIHRLITEVPNTIRIALNVLAPKIGAILGFFTGLGPKILARIGAINLMSRFSDPTGSIVRWFGNLRQRILSTIGNPNLFGLFDNPTSKIVAWFASLRSRILGAIGNINLLANVNNPTDQIVSWFYGLGGRIVSAIGSIDLSGLVHLPNIPGVDEPWNASGKIYYGPTKIGVGEAGPEAIVPLDRPLSMVDPSVRALSAFAQGLIPGSTDTSRKIDASGWTVVSPGADPEAVAKQVINELVPLTF